MALMERAQQFLDNNGQAKEVRIVDFPEFRGEIKIQSNGWKGLKEHVMLIKFMKIEHFNS
jgi:hypothetical protein